MEINSCDSMESTGSLYHLTFVPSFCEQIKPNRTANIINACKHFQLGLINVIDFAAKILEVFTQLMSYKIVFMNGHELLGFPATPEIPIFLQARLFQRIRWSHCSRNVPEPGLHSTRTIRN